MTPFAAMHVSSAFSIGRSTSFPEALSEWYMHQIIEERCLDGTSCVGWRLPWVRPGTMPPSREVHGSEEVLDWENTESRRQHFVVTQ